MENSKTPYDYYHYNNTQSPSTSNPNLFPVISSSTTANEIKIKLSAKPDKKWCIDGEKFEYDGKEYHIKVAQQMKFLTPQETANSKLFK